MTINEKKFVKDMKDITKTTKLLLTSNENKAAYSYQLCFYSAILGFIERCFNKNEEIYNLFFEDNSINLNILPTLKRHFEEEHLNEKESENIYYWYTIGYSTKPNDSSKTLNKLLKLHEEITAEIIKEEKRFQLMFQKN